MKTNCFAFAALALPCLFAGAEDLPVPLDEEMPRFHLRDPATTAEKTAQRLQLKNPPNCDASPSVMGHYGSTRQASTWLTGPISNEVDVQIVDFDDALGKQVGTSPWHIVSTRRYEEPAAVTVWGTSLTDAYRFVVDGPRFEGLDRFVVNPLPLSIPWNLVGLDNGRVIIPDQDGFGQKLLRRKQTQDPSFLVLTDDPAGNGQLDNGISLEQVIEIDTEAVIRLCAFEGGELLKRFSFTDINPTYTGEFAVSAVFEKDGKKSTYLVMLDARLEPIAAEYLDDGIATNARAAERIDEAKTAIYLASEDGVIKATWDSAARTLIRNWERPAGIRGRTGTTPTLLNTRSGEQFVLLIEAKAAVMSVMNGLIVASRDDRPSALVAIRREDDLPEGTPKVLRTELPGWLSTVENSPAVFGETVVVANYSGYLPNGLLIPAGGHVPEGGPATWMVSPDAIADFATGIATLTYDAKTKRFDLLWVDAEVQFSGVPAISGGANRVYGTGCEKPSGMTYLYGYRLRTDAEGPAGEQVLRAELGKAPFRNPTEDRQGNVIFRRWDYDLQRGEFFDAGNNIVFLEDGSLIVSGGRGLARIRDRKNESE
ncbi:MAG: hypothetical protein AAGA58_05715 [Verrucomicrobiota bacterium]